MKYFTYSQPGVQFYLSFLLTSYSYLRNPELFKNIVRVHSSLRMMCFSIFVFLSHFIFHSKYTLTNKLSLSFRTTLFLFHFITSPSIKNLKLFSASDPYESVKGGGLKVDTEIVLYNRQESSSKLVRLAGNSVEAWVILTCFRVVFTTLT